MNRNSVSLAYDSPLIACYVEAHIKYESPLWHHVISHQSDRKIKVARFIAFHMHAYLSIYVFPQMSSWPLVALMGESSLRFLPAMVILVGLCRRDYQFTLHT